MAIRKILIEGEDDLLRKHSRPVEKFDKRLWTLLDDMAQTMYDADGAGLAAPQVGVLKRCVVIDVGEGLLELVNPKIVWSTGSVVRPEGCLSVPGRYGFVKRPMVVRVRAQDRNGNTFEVEDEGLTARCFCHEIDHLSGHLFDELVDRTYTVEEIEQMEEEGREVEE